MRFFNKKSDEPVQESSMIQDSRNPHTGPVNGEKGPVTGAADADAVSDTAVPEVAADYQAGVQKVEAVTTIWKKWDLFGAYFM